MAAEAEIPLSVLARYFRVPTRDIAVDYPGREVLLGSAITNVSVNGVYVRTPRPLPEGTSLAIAFTLPGEKRMVRADTVVRWSVAGDAGGRGMGLEFTRIAKRDQRAVERFVRAFIERMRGSVR